MPLFRTLLLIVFAAAGPDAGRQAEAQISRPVNLLGGHIIYDMVEDADGNLWFGTENGLVRYDGHTMRRFTTADGLPGNSVLYVGADGAGRVWALDFTGAASFVQRGVLHTPASNPLLEQAAVPGMVHTTIFTDADTAWIAWEQKHVMRFTPDRADSFFLPDSLNISIRHIARESSGNITLASVDSLYSLVPGSLRKHASMSKSFTPGRVFYYRGVPYAPFGLAWQRMEMQDGAAPAGTASPWLRPETGTLKFPQAEIRGRMFTAQETYDGYIALGTTEGLYFISPDPQKPVKAALEGMFINRVLQDKEGNVWASTLGSGVYKFPAGFWKISGFESADAGLPALRSLRILPNGGVMYGTASEAFAFFQDNQLSVMALPELMASRFGTQLLLIDFWGEDIVLASANALFTGALHTGGTVDFDNGTYMSVGGVKQVIQVSENRMYAAATMGILQIDRTAGTQPEEKLLYTGRVTAIAHHPEPGIIAGGVQGLWRLESGELIPFIPQLANAQITDLKRIGEHELLVATNGSGLWKVNLKTEEARRFFQGDERLLNIREIRTDDDGYWWLAASTGVYQYHPETAVLRTRDTGNIRRLDVSNGILAYITSDVAVVASAGPFERPAFRLRLNQPELLADNLRLPLVPAAKQPLIAGFDGPSEAFETVSLPFNTRLIQLDTSTPYFSTEGGMKYFYRLSPGDLQWQTSPTPDFTFRLLRPGSYQLQIRAEAPDAEPAAAFIIPFVIESPFWQKSWFIALLILGLAGLAGLFVKAQLSRVKRKEEAKLLQYKKTVELEQQALTAMMNPHFVFNVLNTIRQFMNSRDDGKADEYLQLFARLIRLQLEATFRKSISLREELNLLEMYVKLEKTRIQNPFEFRISLTKEVQEETDEIEIPSMLIQPFLENALLHGIQPSGRPGLVTLKLALKDQNTLEIELADNGAGFENGPKPGSNDHTSLALKLIEQRLELMKPDASPEFALSVKSTVGEGTTVRFFVPV